MKEPEKPQKKDRAYHPQSYNYDKGWNDACAVCEKYHNWSITKLLVKLANLEPNPKNIKRFWG